MTGKNMKITVNVVLTILLAAFVLNSVYSQTPSKGGDIAGEPSVEISSMNNRIEVLYIKKDANSLAGLYSKDLTFLPEYKPSITEIGILKKFYSDWFKVVDIRAYKKSPYKVEAFSNYILEIGTFRMDYLVKGNTEHSYTGKYMVMWKRNPKGVLKILSEAFGSDRYIESENVPYATIAVEERNALDKNIIGGKLKAEVEAFDSILTRAVKEGNSSARLDGFAKDGIYMPIFESVLEGTELLKPYMIKIYRSEAGLFVKKNTYREIFNLGEYVFINGHFKGGWGDSNNGGNFEGNMTNLMKRDGDGKLKMYRQLVNNDRKTVAFKK
jgi:ketosteroid isomerase-like protein